MPISVEADTEKIQVKRIARESCCKRRCLRQLPEDAALAVVRGCLKELKSLSLYEKKLYLLEKVRSCVKTKHEESGYFSF